MHNRPTLENKKNNPEMQYHAANDGNDRDFGCTSKIIGNWADITEATLGMTQISMLEYRKSLSIDFKIGSFSKFKTSYIGIGKVASKAGKVSTYIGALNLYLDAKAVRNNELSPSRFLIRAGSFGSSIAAGALVGGPWGIVAGAAVGGISVGCEYIYDEALLPIWKETNFQIWQFENSMKNLKIQ